MRQHTLVKVAGLISIGIALLLAACHRMYQEDYTVIPYRVASLVEELEQLYRIDLLPQYRTGSVVEQISSYDRTGKNQDGFTGEYSYVRKEGDDYVLADLEGPGVIHRIWTATPTTNTLEFYFDGESEPRISMEFLELFSGGMFPLVKPLVGHEIGGYFCYLPIPYKESCKIVFRGEKIRFHQIQYRKYPEEYSIESFPREWSEAEKRALQRIAELWEMQGADIVKDVVMGSESVRTFSRDITIKPGQSVELFKLKRGGRIVEIELEAASAFRGLHKDLLLQVNWDNELQPAVYCPVADFFGYAYGEPSMQSLLLGTRGELAYCYLPMPFDESAVMRLIYKKREDVQQPVVKVRVKISYLLMRRNPEVEGKLYTVWRREIEPKVGKPYLICDMKGKGHHVGTILQAQGLRAKLTAFFEGDDVTVIDGEMRIHGTGSEDYFNGGWYAVPDRWDQAMSLAIHGALDYSVPWARTGGYRLHLSDKVSFEKSYKMTIEHGPVGNKEPVDYGSVAFYYGDSAPEEVMEPSSELRTVQPPDTYVLLPQMMKVTVGWHTEADFTDWRAMSVVTTRDGLMRIELDEIPEGTYKLYFSYYELPEGCEFSVWQRQKQVSEWRSTYAGEERLLERQFLGEVEVSRFVKTLTIKTRKLGENNRFKFRRVYLER